MSQANAIGFGWVVQPVPMSGQAREMLRADNKKFLALIGSYFQTAWLEDHFQWLSDKGSNDTLEGWTHLAYLMGLYPMLRFGTLVLGQSYRNPAMLAKMATTLHYLTDGRLILGIGAGWKEDEYRAYGYPFPAPGVRTRQLDEYAQIVKLMLTQSPASFTGKYYHIENAYNDPLPTPPMPLLIGGGGEKGTLRTTAKYADWWNHPWRTPTEFTHKLDVLKQHCAAVGRDFNELTLTTCQFVSLSEDPSRVQRQMGNLSIVAGNADEVTRQLETFINLGARHFMLRFRDFPSTEGIELFLNKVLPRFQ
jgi:alkanesulfonate monooxygenase SsuD/methylene tetrahydromethanopterin reductase-like flavin-dependent oxidoreductase (luciferase family)